MNMNAKCQNAYRITEYFWFYDPTNVAKQLNGSIWYGLIFFILTTVA